MCTFLLFSQILCLHSLIHLLLNLTLICLILSLSLFKYEGGGRGGGGRGGMKDRALRLGYSEKAYDVAFPPQFKALE